MTGWTPLPQRTSGGVRRQYPPETDQKQDIHPEEHTPCYDCQVEGRGSTLRTIYLASFQVDKDVVIVMYGVGISIGVPPSPLEVFPTDQAAVYVDIG